MFPLFLSVFDKGGGVFICDEIQKISPRDDYFHDIFDMGNYLYPWWIKDPNIIKFRLWPN